MLGRQRLAGRLVDQRRLLLELLSLAGVLGNRPTNHHVEQAVDIDAERDGDGLQLCMQLRSDLERDPAAVATAWVFHGEHPMRWAGRRPGREWDTSRVRQRTLYRGVASIPEPWSRLHPLLRLPPAYRTIGRGPVCARRLGGHREENGRCPGC